MQESADNTTGIPDAELVRACRGGDKRAFDTLVGKHFGSVYAVAYARVADRETAEDLAQEVFLRAFLHLGSLDDPERFAAWVCRIARNLALDWLRRGQCGSRILPMVNLQDHEQTLADPRAIEPREHAAQHEEHDVLGEAIRKLTVEQRELVLMHYIEDLSHGEIAQRLGMHRTTVCRHLQQSLKTLKGSVEPALRASAPRLASRPEAALRATAIVGATAGLSASAKSAIAAAVADTAQAGTAAQSAGAAASESIAFLKALANPLIIGGKIMSTGKTVTAVVAVAAIIGVTSYYVSENRQQASAPAPSAPSSLGSPVTSQDSLTLGFRAPVGTRWVTHVEIDGANSTTITPSPPNTPNPIRQGVKYGQDLEMNVLEIPAGAGPVVELKYLGMRIEVAGTPASQVVLDTNSNQATPPVLAPALQALKSIVGNPIKVHFDKSGIVTRTEGSFMAQIPQNMPAAIQPMLAAFTEMDSVKDSLGHFVIPFPSNLSVVQPGATWKWTRTIQVPVLGAVEMDIDYHFKGWEELDGRRLAVLENTGTFRSPGSPAANTAQRMLKFTSVDGKFSAKDYMDPALGIVTDSTFNQTIVTKGEMPAAGRTPAMTLEVEVRNSGRVRVEVQTPDAKAAGR